MARVKRAVNAHKKRREVLEQASGYRGQRSRLYRKAKEQVAALAGLRLPRPARPQGRLPQAVDPADQRRGPRGGHHLQPLHLRPEGGRGRGRPQDPGRPRRHRPRGVQRPGRGGPGQRSRPTDAATAGLSHSGRIGATCSARARRSAAPQGAGAGRPVPGRGPQAVGEALTAGAAVEVLVADEVVERHAGCWTARPGTAYAYRSPRPTALAELADTVTPQGVLAICRFVDVPLAEALAGSPRLVVLCDQVRDPGNLGTVIRCADAFGADAVLVSRGLGRPVQPQGRPGQHRQPVPPAAGRRRGPGRDGRPRPRRRPGGPGCRRRAAETTRRPGPLRRAGRTRRSGCSATRPGVCRPTAPTGSTGWSACRCTAGPRA